MTNEVLVVVSVLCGEYPYVSPLLLLLLPLLRPWPQPNRFSPPCELVRCVNVGMMHKSSSRHKKPRKGNVK